MSGFSFRLATADDVAVIVELVESAYRGPASLAGWTSEARLLGGQRIDEQMTRALLAAPGAHVLLTALDGVTVACCELREPAEPGGVGYFGMFAVRPDLQGGGVGRAVLAEAERRARDDFGAGRLEMTVIRQREELIAWYERRGYARTGETHPFPYGDERFGRPTRDDLEFVGLGKALR